VAEVGVLIFFEQVRFFIHDDVQPAAFTTELRNLVMRVADRVEIQFPVFARRIRKPLRFAGDCIHLTACSSNVVNDSTLHLAP